MVGMTNVLGRKVNHIVVVHFKMFLFTLSIISTYVILSNFRCFHILYGKIRKTFSMNFPQTWHGVTLLYLVWGEWSVIY